MGKRNKNRNQSDQARPVSGARSPLQAVNTGGIPRYTLYEAESGNHAAFLWAIGDGSTTRLQLTMRSLRDYPIEILIEPGTSFQPENTSFQMMSVIRPFIMRLEPGETVSVWVNTVCLQAALLAPQNRISVLRSYLRDLGLKEDNIEELLDQDNKLAGRLWDFEQMARRLGYSDVAGFTSDESVARHMSYRLAPLPREVSSSVRRVTGAIERVDKRIAFLSEQAEQPAKDLIEKFGRKRVIEELTTQGKDLESFQAMNYLVQFDSSLANNLFNSSGHEFAPMEAFSLVEFDSYNDPDWRSNPRLNSMVVQYAIWTATDNYSIRECSARFGRTEEQDRLLAAGVRTVLHTATQIFGKRGSHRREFGHGASEPARSERRSSLGALIKRLLGRKNG